MYVIPCFNTLPVTFGNSAKGFSVFSFSDIITSVTEHAFHGRNLDTRIQGGILILRLPKALILATYHAPIVSSQALAYAEKVVDEIRNL
jgi:hypothetical protein